MLDNYATYKTEAVERWLAKHPRWHFHFIPTHSSWLTQGERFFAKITPKRIRRWGFRSVAELQTAIDTCVATHNENATPFKWTASADVILGNVAALCNELA